jgi:predicted metal-dependent hydrolase
MVFGHRDWIARHLPTEVPELPRPDQIAFPSVGETWSVEYRLTRVRTVRVRQVSPGRLCVTGGVDSDRLVRRALRKWCAGRGKEVLGPWLERLSRETGTRFSKILIRGQRTRWGSCSARRVISLNHHLLFLKPELVRYVLIHELCHTVQMNHTRAFWELVRKQDPEAGRHRKELRAAFGNLPPWILRDTN